MMRKANLFVMMVATCAAAYPASAVKKEINEITDPTKAAADPDFAVQGEYVGQRVLPDGSKQKVGAQVIAQGEGTFQVFLLEGGLPEAGWERGDDRLPIDGTRQANVTTLSSSSLSGKIVDGRITITNRKGETKTQLERIERKSPTLGAKPPERAVVLFDGSSADKFLDATMTKQHNLMNGATTKQKFGSYTLHLEFSPSYMPDTQSWKRSNSGVFLHDCYEIQVLDSFGLEGSNEDCGSIWGFREPKLNMCLPPLVWQTYDVEFTAPKYDEAGKKLANARITVRHNGVVIHEDLELPKKSPGRQDEGPGPRPIYFQDHHNHVQYRNIWLMEKE